MINLLQIPDFLVAATVREILPAFPVERRRAVELGVAWMAKLGFVDWLT